MVTFGVIMIVKKFFKTSHVWLKLKEVKIHKLGKNINLELTEATVQNYSVIQLALKFTAEYFSVFGSDSLYIPENFKNQSNIL